MIENRTLEIHQKKINNMPFIEVTFIEEDGIIFEDKTYRPTENMTITKDIYNWLGIEQI
jgi:hypothetical protein